MVFDLEKFIMLGMKTLFFTISLAFASPPTSADSRMPAIVFLGSGAL
jgi:hypothetical protein